jgi:hypothetical protein
MIPRTQVEASQFVTSQLYKTKQCPSLIGKYLGEKGNKPWPNNIGWN